MKLPWVLKIWNDFLLKEIDLIRYNIQSIIAINIFGLAILSTFLLFSLWVDHSKILHFLVEFTLIKHPLWLSKFPFELFFILFLNLFLSFILWLVFLFDVVRLLHCFLILFYDFQCFQVLLVGLKLLFLFFFFQDPTLIILIYK